MRVTTMQPASDRQMRFIERLQGELGWDTDRLQAFADDHFLHALRPSKRQASRLIDLLKKVLAGEPVEG